MLVLVYTGVCECVCACLLVSAYSPSAVEVVAAEEGGAAEAQAGMRTPAQHWLPWWMATWCAMGPARHMVTAASTRTSRHWRQTVTERRRWVGWTATARTRAVRRATSGRRVSWAGCVETPSASRPAPDCMGIGSPVCAATAVRCGESGTLWVRGGPRGPVRPLPAGSAAGTGRPARGAGPGRRAASAACSVWPRTPPRGQAPPACPRLRLRPALVGWRWAWYPGTVDRSHTCHLAKGPWTPLFFPPYIIMV